MVTSDLFQGLEQAQYDMAKMLERLIEDWNERNKAWLF